MSRLISLGLVMDCSVNWMRNVLISSAGERKSFNISISYIKYIQNVRSMTKIYKNYRSDEIPSQIFKYLIIQVFKYSSIQAFMYSSI